MKRCIRWQTARAQKYWCSSCPEYRLEVVQHGTGAGRGGIEGKLGLHTARIAGCRLLPCLAAFGQLGIVYMHLQQQLMRVDGNGIAFMHQTYRAAHGPLRCHVANHHAPGSARTAAIGNHDYGLTPDRKLVVWGKEV